MRTRLFIGVLLLAGSLATAAPRRVYSVTWGSLAGSTAERRTLIQQFDRQLRAELLKRGATVTDRKDAPAGFVLRPTLEILPKALRINLVSVRSSDKKLLGAFSMKAAGASRAAQVRALVQRLSSEAGQLE